MSMLPRVKINGEEWFEDVRLREWRKVIDPNERIPFDTAYVFEVDACPTCGETPNLVMEKVLIRTPLKKAGGGFAVETDADFEPDWGTLEARYPHGKEDRRVQVKCVSGHEWETKRVLAPEACATDDDWEEN